VNSDTNVHIAGINYDITRDDMHDYFELNKITPIRVVILKDPEGKSKGCGFAEFATPEEARFAVEKLSGSEVAGRRVTITFAKGPKLNPRPSY
jgi:RNA recognition motif-containing protein